MRNLLATEGGDRAVRHIPPVEWPSVSKVEIAEVVAQLASNNISIYGTDYPIGKLEESFKELTGRKYAITYNSGTSALLTAYYGVGIEEGDEVIVPSYTFWATVTPLIRLGAIPIFVDIHPDTLTIDPQSVLQKIRPATKAVVVNHTWGNPVDLRAIQDICTRHGLILVEDASHAHGATYNGVPIGNFGEVAAFSLQANKPISAGEGGVLVTDNREIFERATLLGHFGPRSIEAITSEALVPFAEAGLGFKLRMAALEAAIGVKQIETLKVRNEIRRENMQYLSQGLSDLPGIAVPIEQPGGTHIYYGYKLNYDADTWGITASEIVRILRTEGVAIKLPDTPPLHPMPLFNNRHNREKLGWPFTSREYRERLDNQCTILPVTEWIAPRLLSVRPLMLLAKEVVEEYVEAFHKVWDWVQVKRRGSAETSH
jgi:dTDP-4-amino-4,6-dideoxygalactose transaminase